MIEQDRRLSVEKVRHTIRSITEQDVGAYHELRLAGLEAHPDGPFLGRRALEVPEQRAEAVEARLLVHRARPLPRRLAGRRGLALHAARGGHGRLGAARVVGRDVFSWRGENKAYLEVHHLYYPEGTPDLYEEQCKPEWL